MMWAMRSAPCWATAGKFFGNFFSASFLKEEIVLGSNNINHVMGEFNWCCILLNICSEILLRSRESASSACFMS